MSKYSNVEQEVIAWYNAGEPIRDIITAHGLTNDKALYYILRKHNIPLRRNGHNKELAVTQTEKRLEPSKPAREWYFVEECATIANVSIDDIEWMIRRGAVYAETTETPAGKFQLVYLPSLIESASHAAIDGKRARQLLQEAWKQLDKVSSQSAIDILDARVVCKAIASFFEAHGWRLG